MANSIDSILPTIFKFRPGTLRLLSRESSQIEFKENFNWASKNKYAKSLASFANNKGGALIFGVKNSPKELVGLQSDNFDDLDEAKITEYLSSVFAPELAFEKKMVKIAGKKVGVIKVFELENKPAICIKNDGEIKEGEIYYRYNALSGKIKYPELNNIIFQIRELEKNNWMKHMQRILKIGPSNAAVLDVANGDIEGVKGTLLLDESLLPKIKFIREGKFTESGWPTLKLIGSIKSGPIIGRVKQQLNVKYTDNPDAQTVTLADDKLLKTFKISDKKLIEEMYKRHNDFKRNAKFYDLRRQLRQNSKLCIQRHFDPTDPNSSIKFFYKPDIFKEFDKYYKR